MDCKLFWLNRNESTGYGHPKINQVRKEDKDEVYLELDKTRKISSDFNQNDRINCKKSKF